MAVTMDVLPQLISDKLPLILPTVAGLLAVVILQTLLARDPLASIPEIGKELGSDEKRRQAFLAKGKDLYRDGYQKVLLHRQKREQERAGGRPTMLTNECSSKMASFGS